MTTLKAIERKTNTEVNVTRTEDGKFAIEGGKTYAASTFKKYYKLIGETVTAEKKDEKKAEKKASKKVDKAVKTVEVIYKTFTGMVIGQGTYTAKVTKDGYTVETKKHGVQKFDKNGIQLGCKNPKFANRITVA